MKITRFILVALLASIALALPARAAESIAIRAVLIVASNSKAPADPRLAAFEAELQRNLPESSFRFVREGSASVADGGHTTISLGSTDNLEVEAKKGPDGMNMKLRWMRGGALHIGTGVIQQAGVPVILGRRPAGDGETPIVVLIAK